MARLTLRLIRARPAIGHGKIRLLRPSGRPWLDFRRGARDGLSYRRAWLLIDALNGPVDEPVVETKHGGPGWRRRRTDAARPSPAYHYRAIDAKAQAAGAGELAELAAASAAAKHPRPGDAPRRATCRVGKYPGYTSARGSHHDIGLHGDRRGGLSAFDGAPDGALADQLIAFAVSRGGSRAGCGCGTGSLAVALPRAPSRARCRPRYCAPYIVCIGRRRRPAPRFWSAMRWRWRRIWRRQLRPLLFAARAQFHARSRPSLV